MSKPMRLSQLSLLIQEALQETFAWKRFWVMAEVSNHSFYSQKGFHYFDLVETENRDGRGKSGAAILSKIPAVAWATGAARIRAFETATGQKFGNEIQVLAEVSVDYHPVYGLKLTLLDIDARFTLGQLEQKRQATISRLIHECPDYVWQVDEILHTFNQELELPRVIQRIAVISSRTAAGYEDFLHSLENNPFHYTFIIDGFFTTVQGENNAPELAATFEDVTKAAARTGIDYDAVVIIRGGGASTDLLIFDQFEIAAAVATCPFPVLTGIGHQKNETITDLMAHTSLKTPTKVAEFILQQNRSFELELLQLQQSVIIYSQQMLAASRQELMQLKSSLIHQSQASLIQHKHDLLVKKQMLARQPSLLLAARQQNLHLLDRQLATANRNFLRLHQNELESLLRLFRMASPEKALQRGFALVESKGKLIANADGVVVGDEIRVILGSTALGTTVNTKTNYDGKPFDL
ncbi:exodeoxyribonuclease VII large subunit [Flavihumibacter stibioxidans]|uniref:Exodeoxyribonuclease 7 large subunit n=1 Tax=Flavihumibacter stibioxidans TaxID=1834163 RepID=A0ABR7M8X3_9BACT|nr:exodeoxyribonuclease VII large subunit [Flavihumibacter stibioxidans]MBC6491461.1 exodeoxyribonuclease VII large subunit [Flavihumibacter stibioxidans]